MSKTIKEQIKNNESEIEDIKDSISTIESKTLEYKGTYQDDLDDLKQTGIYYTNNVTPTNSPTSTFTYATVITIGINSTMITQIGFRVGLSYVYMRMCSGSAATWGDWKQITLS